MWERELRKIKGLYDNRLRASQQKSSKMEQALTNQTYQVNKWMNLDFWGRKLDYASDASPGQFFREWADPSNGYHENWVVTPLGYRSINTHPSKTRLKTSIIAEGISWLLPKVFLGLVHKLLLQIKFWAFFDPPASGWKLYLMKLPKFI